MNSKKFSLLFFVLLTALALAAQGDYDFHFVKDVTLPDGAQVKPNTSYTKTWRLRNDGMLSSKGLYLERMGDVGKDDIQSARKTLMSPKPTDIIEPGKAGNVSVKITTPKKAGEYRADFKMIDKNGNYVMPSKEPIYVDIVVKG